MIKTNLVEFKNKNKNKDILRAILVSPKEARQGVIMCGGFERKATTEKKFKIIADELAKKDIASFRFDYSGCGISDGDFSKISVERLTEEFEFAFNKFKEHSNLQKISVVAHSLSACVIANAIKKLNFEKIDLMSPALNQKDLLRYYFTVSIMKKKDLAVKITWDNFKNYLDEKEFEKDCLKEDKMTKEHYIKKDYFLENRNKDYSDFLKGAEDKILHLHGASDDKVPLASLNIKFLNSLLIPKGGHDLERPDMLKHWVNKAIDFLAIQ